jgi:hypothetical protein
MSTNTPRSLLKGWTTEITIAAPQSIIWNHLIDFASYSDWNPFMLEAHATLKVCGKIRFLETLQDFGQHWITAKFLTIAAPHEFVWQGYIYAPFLFNVRHSFQLESISSCQTRFTHSHQHTGLLVPYLCDRGVFQRSYEGYLTFNEALKKRCEPKNH